MTKGKTTLIQEDHPLKGDPPQQLQTNNVSVYDAENPDRSNKKNSITHYFIFIFTKFFF